MKRTLHRLSFAAVVVVFTLGALACNTDPACAPGEDSYRICSHDEVWECPVGTAAQLAEKQRVEDECNQQPDPIQCLLETEREMFPMTLIADCKGGGQICVETVTVTVHTATCEDE